MINNIKTRKHRLSCSKRQRPLLNPYQVVRPINSGQNSQYFTQLPKLHNIKLHKRNHNPKFRKQTKIRNIQRKKNKHNIIMRYVYCFVRTLSGDANIVNRCARQVPGLRAHAIEEEKSKTTQTQLAGSTMNIFNKIFSFLGVAIDMCCYFKNKIVEFFTEKSRRRYRRLFLQGKLSLMHRNIFSKLWRFIKNSVTNIAQKAIKAVKWVASRVRDAGVYVVNRAKDAYQFIKKKLLQLFRPVFNWFERMKENLLNWIKQNKLLSILITFCECFQRTFMTSQKLKKTVNGLISLVPSLATPVGWINLVVNLICNWKKLKESIIALRYGLMTRIKHIKYCQFGIFTAKLFEAISG